MHLLTELIYLKTDHFSYTSADRFPLYFYYYDAAGGDILFILPTLFGNCEDNQALLPHFLLNYSVVVIPMRDAPLDQQAMDIYTIIRQHRTLHDYRFAVLLDVFDAELGELAKQRYPVNFDGLIKVQPYEVVCNDRATLGLIASRIPDLDTCYGIAAELYAYEGDACEALDHHAKGDWAPLGDEVNRMCRRSCWFPPQLEEKCSVMLMVHCYKTFGISPPEKPEVKDGIFNSEQEDRIGIYVAKSVTRNAGAFRCNGVYNLFEGVQAQQFAKIVETFRQDMERKRNVAI